MNWTDLKEGDTVILPKAMAVREFKVQQVLEDYVWLEAFAIRRGPVPKGYELPNRTEAGSTKEFTKLTSEDEK